MSGQEGYLLKPMNCPHHIQIYKAVPKSYRDLPLKLAEFGTVYRYEQSGELGGMTRVRGFTQDDAHLFVTPEQVEGELRSEIDLVLFILKHPEPDRLPGAGERARPGQQQVRRRPGRLGEGRGDPEGHRRNHPRPELVTRSASARRRSTGRRSTSS